MLADVTRPLRVGGVCKLRLSDYRVWAEGDPKIAQIELCMVLLEVIHEAALLRGCNLLQVIDNAGDTGDGAIAGTLESWTIRLNEDWDGGIFVGDNVTVQETLVVRGELRVEYGGSLVMTNTDGDETVRVEAED